MSIRTILGTIYTLLCIVHRRETCTFIKTTLHLHSTLWNEHQHVSVSLTGERSHWLGLCLFCGWASHRGRLLVFFVLAAPFPTFSHWHWHHEGIIVSTLVPRCRFFMFFIFVALFWALSHRRRYHANIVGSISALVPGCMLFVFFVLGRCCDRAIITGCAISILTPGLAAHFFIVALIKPQAQGCRCRPWGTTRGQRGVGINVVRRGRRDIRRGMARGQTSDG